MSSPRCPPKADSSGTASEESGRSILVLYDDGRPRREICPGKLFAGKSLNGKETSDGATKVGKKARDDSPERWSLDLAENNARLGASPPPDGSDSGDGEPLDVPAEASSVTPQDASPEPPIPILYLEKKCIKKMSDLINVVILVQFCGERYPIKLNFFQHFL